MSLSVMTSMERTLTALGHQEPDRVPFFLFPTMHGAKELGLTLKEYFSAAEHVVEGQLRLRAKYRGDCVSPFFYAAIEVEAWGGEVVYRDDGPPNSGTPVIRDAEAVQRLEAPRVEDCACLRKVLSATEMLKERVGEEVPIIGVVISPFSLPVMQMGFENYLDLIFERPDMFARLMELNEEFCVEWANAQIEAGATAIGYFDPLASTTITPRETYLETGFEVAKRVLPRINGPTVTHLASGRCMPIIDDLVQTGTAAIGVSVLEDLAELKVAARGRLALLGNLNGIEMRRWTPKQAEAAVKAAIAKAGPGGGYLLSDNHGEIPWQVPDEVLMAISDAVHRWGYYPLDWIEEYGQ